MRNGQHPWNSWIRKWKPKKTPQLLSQCDGDTMEPITVKMYNLFERNNDFFLLFFFLKQRKGKQTQECRTIFPALWDCPSLVSGFGKLIEEWSNQKAKGMMRKRSKKLTHFSILVLFTWICYFNMNIPYCEFTLIFLFLLFSLQIIIRWMNEVLGL